MAGEKMQRKIRNVEKLLGQILMFVERVLALP